LWTKICQNFKATVEATPTVDEAESNDEDESEDEIMEVKV
jgi:hypothetical protein